MNEFNISIDSSGDELINSTFSLLEKSQDIVNMAPVFCDCFTTLSNQLIIYYLLTGYPFRTEIYQALSHFARTSLRSVRTSA